MFRKRSLPKASPVGSAACSPGGLNVALLDRLKGSSPSPSPDALPAKQPTNGKRTPAAPDRDALYQDLKSRVHNRLFDVIDFARISTVSEDRVCADIATATIQILEEEKFLLTLEERERFVGEIQHEVFGLGPLEPLLEDPTISDILVNGSGHIFIERHGKIEKTVARFRDDAHLMRIIEKIVSAVGR
jgi:pilus assembly protein CpaF